jgi:hypothetical protein
VDEGMHYYTSMIAVYSVHDLCKFGISLAWSTFLAVFGHLQEAEIAQGLQNPHCDVKMGEHFTR